MLREYSDRDSHKSIRERRTCGVSLIFMKLVDEIKDIERLREQG